MKYRCLVLDHDDTAVMSTPSVHHPSFLDTLSHLRPGETIALSDYNRLCFDPGFERLCYEHFRFTREEMAWQLENWQRHVEKKIPPFHAGMPEIIRRQKEEGGLLCVVSQSYSRFILRDYAAANLPAPDLTLGWELGPEHQKPHAEPLHIIMERFNLSPADILMVDDLKPGFDMALAAGCDHAAALWTYAENPEMRDFVCKNAPSAIPLLTVADLEQLQFG